MSTTQIFSIISHRTTPIAKIAPLPVTDKTTVGGALKDSDLVGRARRQFRLDHGNKFKVSQAEIREINRRVAETCAKIGAPTAD